MKKILKKITIFLIILILLLTVFVAAWVFFIFPRFVAPEEERAEVEFSPVKIADESEKIDFNESNGILYVNDEIIVFVRDSTSEDKISALFSSFEAEIDESMADINVYRLVLKKAITYDDLESLIKKIESDPIVECAFLNTVTGFETDASDESDNFDYKNPAYPDDPWNGDTWNVDAPRGENWGMEAIDAPGAWGYLDQMTPVRIGLIDTMPDLSHEDISLANSTCLFIDEHTGVIEINKSTISADDHGTHVAGIMNAKWNNGIGSLNDGVSGVLGGKGELYYSKAYYVDNGKSVPKYDTAYSYLLTLKTLIDQNVQVINISMNTDRLVGFAASHGNQNAINYLSMQASLTEKGLSRIIAAREAENKPDFVICVAAGNSNNIYYYKDDKAVYGYRTEMTNWEEIKWIFGWRGEIGNSFALYNNFLSLMDAPEVKDRVIVVGAVGIDDGASTSNSTKYEYANYSNVGSRVDIVAPGTQVYSCIVDGYGYATGTSMATPHVSGVAGLIFACNPSLSGPDVKNILIASGTGRYYYGEEYSGLLNANNAVVKALETVETPVEKVLKTEVDSGLDLCFLVDTTASMGDDIENAKDNMENILEHLAAKTENYRVALIDYRDYPERSNDSRDYPYKVQLSFTSNNESITDAITGLDLGNGGDDKETVYSALMSSVELDWRSDAKKVIIILGDAAPLDPEPITEFTYDDVLLALFNADVNIDYEESDDRVVGALDTSLINIFSIGTDASSDAEDFFEDISSSTGGSYVNVEDASKVSDAIVDSIEQIEVDENVTVRVDFGDDMANKKINLYNGEEYLFTMESDENGEVVIDAVEADTYRWTSNGLFSGGLIDVDADSRYAAVRMMKDYWFTPLLQWWYQHGVLIGTVFVAYLGVCITIPVLIKSIRMHNWKKKSQISVWEKAIPVSENSDLNDNHSLHMTGSPQIISGDEFCLNCDRSSNVTSTKYKMCPKCGNQCGQNAKYCSKCGTKIDSGIKKQINS